MRPASVELKRAMARSKRRRRRNRLGLQAARAHAAAGGIGERHRGRCGVRSGRVVRGGRDFRRGQIGGVAVRLGSRAGDGVLALARPVGLDVVALGLEIVGLARGGRRRVGGGLSVFEPVVAGASYHAVLTSGSARTAAPGSPAGAPPLARSFSSAPSWSAGSQPSLGGASGAQRADLVRPSTETKECTCSPSRIVLPQTAQVASRLTRRKLAAGTGRSQSANCPERV